MAQDRTDDDELLWSMLWRLEEVARALHEQVDDLLDDEPLLSYESDYYTERYGDLPDESEWRHQPQAAEHADYYTERYGEGADEPATVDLGSPDAPEAVDLIAHDPAGPGPQGSGAHGLGTEAVPTWLGDEPIEAEPTGTGSAASFRGRVRHEPSADTSGCVTSAFHNVVYGIDEPADRDSLRSLLERRAFNELWVHGADADGDRFIEFFAAEGFGNPRV